MRSVLLRLIAPGLLGACVALPASAQPLMRWLVQDPKRETWLRAWWGQRLAAAERARLLRFLDERARRGPQLE